MATVFTGATNALARLISIEVYGSATVRSAQTEPTTSTKYVKYNKKNSLKKKGNGTYSVTSNEVQVTAPNYIKYGKKITSGKNKGKQCKITWRGAYTAKGFLSTIDDTYIRNTTNKYKNTYFTDTCSSRPVGGTNLIRTPTAVNITFSDINVEGSGKEKTVTESSRGTTGKLNRNRVRDNVVQMDIEWQYLSDAEAKAILNCLSPHGSSASASKASQWVYVEFFNPYSGGRSRKRMCASDRNISNSYKGKWVDLKVTLTEK